MSIIDRLRLFVFDYWHFLLFGVFSLIVVISVLYFNQLQYGRRSDRLNRVNIDKQFVYRDPGPTAPPDNLVGQFLLPPIKTRVLLPSNWRIRQEWGPPVRAREHRIPDMTFQPPPPLSGPDVSS